MTEPHASGIFAATDIPADLPPKDQFCDLVMKGGITSGIVYPRAIVRLAIKYHFHSIGGTSAGAIAAAVTAAAEYQRRQSGSDAGFALLDALPEQLGASVPELGADMTKLKSLFQPNAHTQRLFSVAMAALSKSATGKSHPVRAVLLSLLEAYWLNSALAVCLALLALSLHWLNGLGSLLLAGVALVAAVGWGVYRDLSHAVVHNGYGLCSGLTHDPKHWALTPWLHDLIQRAAGLTDKDPPLTFGQLWAAQNGPPQPEGQPPRAINLQMFSTNLAHGRPYVFPLVEPAAPADPSQAKFRDHDRLFFTEHELAKVMPRDVVKWLCDNARSYTVEPGREGHDPDPSQAQRLRLREMPAPENFPVLLAARMSLSFPVLFSAIPLWAIDYDSPPGQREFRRCWFSDGGICSNFPMHLFDGLLPRWPTFGIDLEPKIKGRGHVFLPQSYKEGYGERWNLAFTQGTRGVGLGGFLGAIVSTMQNWGDNSLARMPGVRDRIARVRLDDNQGGLHLNMSKDVMDQVVQHGQNAAELLLQRFAPGASGATAPGWDEQRFVRLGVLLKMLAARAPSVGQSLDPTCPHAKAYSDLIAQWTQAAPPGDAPPGYGQPLSPQQAQALQSAVQELHKLAQAMQDPANAIDFRPLPQPELRVRPQL